MFGHDRCRCPRCERVVERRSGSLLGKVLFAASWVMVLPWAATLAVTGAGVFLVAPFFIALSLSLVAVFRDVVFPEPLCSECGCALDHAPITHEEELPASLALPAVASRDAVGWDDHLGPA